MSEYEAVHSVRHWKDIKHRVGPYRRVFAFIHRSLPREPIVILHSALVQEPSSSVQVWRHGGGIVSTFYVRLKLFQQQEVEICKCVCMFNRMYLFARLLGSVKPNW